MCQFHALQCGVQYNGSGKSVGENLVQHGIYRSQHLSLRILSKTNQKEILLFGAGEGEFLSIFKSLKRFFIYFWRVQY